MIKIGRVGVSLEQRKMFLDGQALRIGTRAFDILEVLIKAGDRLVSKEELLRCVWPDSVVEESNLQVQISSLRKLLGDDKDLIKTIPGRGYRLIRAHESDGLVSPPSGDASTAGDHPSPNNVPLSFTPLIGRRQAVDEIRQALDASPLVTLVGTGGIGKTQLGLETARALIPLFAEVRHIDLSPVKRPECTLDAIADALALATPESGRTEESVASAIGSRQLLIVLDNCEHVIQEAASICERLIQGNPNLKILVTSREPLRASFEQIYGVAPLEVPDEDADCDAILQCSAVQMFISRARARDPHFSADGESIQLIGTICRRLDGLPLALELAAARVTALGVSELVAQLDNRFRVLTGGLRTAPARQQTLKAALDWSHQFLCNRERTVLRRLGVFRGSFQLNGACEVTARDDMSAGEVAEAIAGLASKSLLMVGPNGCYKTYYLLETTRAYALQMLAHAGECDIMNRRYERYLRTRGVAAIEPDRAGPSYRLTSDEMQEV